MANVKISQLPIGVPTSTSIFPFVDSGATYQGAISALTSNSTVEVTYSELVDNITGETLNTGSFYIITDFRTCYDQPDFNYNGNSITTGNYKQAEIEPIVVLATSANTISTTAYQPSYPNDRIQYDWTFNITEVTSGTSYGRITERIDEFNNRTDYDHRTILFKRYDNYYYEENDISTGTIELIENTGEVIGTETVFSDYNTGDYIAIPSANGTFFEIISISGNTSMVVSGLTIPAVSAGASFYSAQKAGITYKQNNISSGYTENPTFLFDNETIISNYIGDVAMFRNWNGNDFLLPNNVFGEDVIGNRIGNNFMNNTFRRDVEHNVIGDEFENNTIYNDSDFTDNQIATNFRDNLIICEGFNDNVIGDGFSDNKIFNTHDFVDNQIGVGFNNNTIYDNFGDNKIGNGFSYNNIFENFDDNLLGNYFDNNTIYSSFYKNEIGHIFQNNTISTLADSGNYVFSENNIGNDFESNVITQDFRKNEIGYGFYNNNISGDTSTNRIGEQFENNTIYGSFSDNQIFNEFKGNITYQSFTENRVDLEFTSNQISGFCSDNSFGPSIVSNDFLGSVYGNTFKGGVYGNTIGDNFATNNIGFSFGDNIIGENFGYGAGEPQGNIIGNGFEYNSIGEYFYNNSIPDNFKNNEIGNYFQWNVINTSIDYTNFTLNYGNITGFSYTSAGTGATDTIYTNLTGTTNGHGVGATFDVEVSGGTVIGVSGNTEGRLYVDNDELTILGTQIGGVIGVIDGFSSDAVGKSGTTGSYTGITASGTGGENATFDIDVAGDLVTDIYLNNGGEGYSVNETLTIVGSDFGGIDGVDDITITVNSLYSDNIVITVTGTTSGSSFYQHYTKQIFERRLGNKRVSFYDEEDILNVDSIYEVSGYIPVYSQIISFPLNNASFEFWCDGSFSNDANYTGVDGINNSQELITLFNNNFRQFGYFFDNNDGTIGLYINPSLKQQYCPSGAYTINVFND